MFFEVYSFKSKSSSNVYQLFCSQPSLRNISSISYSRVCFHHVHQIDMASCKFASGISHLLRTRIFHLLKIFKKGLNIPQRLPKAVNRRTDSRMANKKKQRFTRHYTESKRSRNIITGYRAIICTGRARSSCSTRDTRRDTVKRHELLMKWKSCWTQLCVNK